MNNLFNLKLRQTQAITHNNPQSWEMMNMDVGENAKNCLRSRCLAFALMLFLILCYFFHPSPQFTHDWSQSSTGLLRNRGRTLSHQPRESFHVRNRRKLFQYSTKVSYRRLSFTSATSAFILTLYRDGKQFSNYQNGGETRATKRKA